MNLIDRPHTFSKKTSARIDNVVDKIAPLVRPAIVVGLVGTYALAVSKVKTRHDELLAEI